MAEPGEKRRMTCPHCRVTVEFPARLAGHERPCPKCLRAITLEARPATGATPAPGPSPAAAVPPPAAGPLSEGPGAGPPPSPEKERHAFTPVRPPGKEGPAFLERMRANRVLAGRICPGCGQEIDLGDDVFNCPSCNVTMHFACREQHGGCANPDCPAYQAAAPAAAAAPAGGAAAPPAGADLVPCRFCGEPITRQARRCLYCGEYQQRVHPRFRARQDPLSQKATTAMVLGILGLVFSTVTCCPPLGIGLGTGAIVLGGKAKASTTSAGKANAGFIMGIIAVVLGGLGLVWLLFMIGVNFQANGY